MNSLLALLIYTVGIAGLFFLDRDKSVRTSKALWLPVIWLAIVGSRPVSLWLGMGTVSTLSNQLAESSFIDGLIYEILLALGVLVLIHRRSRIATFLKGSWPILFYISFCLLSVTWSDYPDVSFKRWIKSIGDLVMVLIVVTDAEPAQAFKRLISRVGFVLLPASVLMIKYFDSGRGYDPVGNPMNTGVTTTKNTLGVVTLTITLGVLWNFLTLRRDKGQSNRGRHLVAQGTLLIFGLVLLWMAHSATSGACFILGATLMVTTSLPMFGRRPAAVHALVLAIVLIGGLFLVFGQASVMHMLGRQSDLTGRTEIWKAVTPQVQNPVVGTGFESFWLGPRLNMVWNQLSKYMHVNEAHNGYLEVYLNLGWVGVGLITLVLVNGYRRVVGLFRHDPMLGSLWLAYLIVAVTYSFTEAGFRLLSPIWIFLLLAIVAASGVPRTIPVFSGLGTFNKRGTPLRPGFSRPVAPSVSSSTNRLTTSRRP
jgi:O-antigen ligase